MQSALRILYPPQCVSCDAPTADDFALCGDCWRETPFISGLVCDLCGAPLPGEDEGHLAHCDTCMAMDRPWQQGRAAMVYAANARKMILAMKHGDRPELARAAAPWLARALQPMIQDQMVIVPVPIHWSRRLKRKYNQSAELCRMLARKCDLPHHPQALVRSRKTKPHDGMDAQARFVNMKQAISPHPKYGRALKGRHVLIVDDVMTSGATFDAATHASVKAGAASVRVLSLARVARDA